ncbi:MAG: hypothetical protein ACI4WQ_06045, partial [Sharpea porci]
MEEKNVNKSGFAVAALVLGIVGIVFSFIPIINNGAFVLGVLAAIFGIISLAKKASKGKAIAGLVLGILAIVITLVMQSAFSSALDDTSKKLDKAAGNSTNEVLKKEVNVTLGAFEANKDEYGIVSTKLPVTVKNITDKKHSYSIHIEAVDANGKRIADDYVNVNDLGGNQSQ